jgi:3-deoxy-D-manno-octulosonic-acid transferase
MFFYKLFATVFYPLIRAHLWLRRRRAKEDADPARFGERLGRPTKPRPRGFLIWLHGASVGELNSMRGLIPRIRADYPRANILLTSGTVTSAKTAKSMDAIHQYAPIDVPFIVRRFMRHWRPDMALRVDSDLWPAQLDALRRAGVPNFLVNGAVSAKSFRRYMRRPRMIKRVMAAFSMVMAKSDKDALRLASMGAENVMVIDNLKYAAPPPPDKPAERAAFLKAAGARPMWHAAVLGEGEADAIFAAHRIARKKVPGAILIITPRHPSMKLELARAAKDLAVVFRSDGAMPDARADVYAADTIGEMGLFYRCARAAFMGRSLCPDCRGSSPIEAMQTGNAVATGNHTSTFDEVYGEMSEKEILTRISGPEDLAAWVVKMLSGKADTERLQKETKKFIDKKSAVLDVIMGQLEECLN